MEEQTGSDLTPQPNGVFPGPHDVEQEGLGSPGVKGEQGDGNLIEDVCRDVVGLIEALLEDLNQGFEWTRVRSAPRAEALGGPTVDAAVAILEGSKKCRETRSSGQRATASPYVAVARNPGSEC